MKRVATSRCTADFSLSRLAAICVAALVVAAGSGRAKGQFPKAQAAPGVQPVADWLGIAAPELSARERTALKVTDVAGAVVVGVYPGSPAEAAGLRLGDVIVEINGKPIRTADELSKWNQRLKSGGGAPQPSPAGEAVIVYEREGVRRRIPLPPVVPPGDRATVLAKPAEAGQAWAQYELAGLLRSANPPDAVQAQVWLKKASDNGFAAARAALGMMLLAGEGGAPDRKQGVELLASCTGWGSNATRPSQPFCCTRRPTWDMPRVSFS
jgi:hypothetical protein